MSQGRQKDDETGLDPVVYAPFYDLLKDGREKEAAVRGADAKWLAKLTVQMVEQILRDGVGVVGFWRNATRQEELRSRLFMFLDENEIVSFDHCDTVADRLMELTKANHEKLVRPA